MDSIFDLVNNVYTTLIKNSVKVKDNVNWNSGCGNHDEERKYDHVVSSLHIVREEIFFYKSVILPHLCSV